MLESADTLDPHQHVNSVIALLFISSVAAAVTYGVYQYVLQWEQVLHEKQAVLLQEERELIEEMDENG